MSGQRRSGRIQGVVVNAAGNPVEGAVVMIVESDRPHPDIAAVSDERGAFRFELAPSGRCTIRACGPMGDEARVSTSCSAGGLTNVQLKLGDRSPDEPRTGPREEPPYDPIIEPGEAPWSDHPDVERPNG